MKSTPNNTVNVTKPDRLLGRCHKGLRRAIGARRRRTPSLSL